MKLVIQRVSRAQVEVEGRVTGSIGKGFLVLFGAEEGDNAALAQDAARKVAGLRVFEDAAGKMNLDLAAVAGSVLVVSQFTLAADLSRGRRPGFERALEPSAARELYEEFVRALSGVGVPVATGVFGAMMKVSLVNEGPATFLLELARAAIGRLEGGGDMSATSGRPPAVDSVGTPTLTPAPTARGAGSFAPIRRIAPVVGAAVSAGRTRRCLLTGVCLRWPAGGRPEEEPRESRRRRSDESAREKNRAGTRRGKRGRS